MILAALSEFCMDLQFWRHSDLGSRVWILYSASLAATSSSKISNPDYACIKKNMRAEDFEPYYQVPKSQEPYYEVPKTKFIPLYENVDIVRAAAMRSSEAVDLTVAGCTNQQPPKEKPPPPPVDMIPDDRLENAENFKRINSTKRIKNEIRNSRTSFLGIESHDENGGQLSFAHLLKSNASDQQDSRSEQNYLLKARSYSDVASEQNLRNHCGLVERFSRMLYYSNADRRTGPTTARNPLDGSTKRPEFRRFVRRNSGPFRAYPETR
ncbi:conserved hypothetical protein [Culex quinquefasciatus]|uniref:Uncharacterized protein n=1 Tax=Culex quinquefasciatus TaxID=7176 RepID=B0X7R2_CULQU|nr:conserved hypothetical protein [Culex quinquefasciatus]|eukprot:XP_001865684.1 conserved hypothetical protein [Culex quinquefasciatus]